MPKRTNDFQRMVVRIHEALAGPGVTVQESALLKEKNSDAEREVDVLITASLAGNQMRIAIECRDRGRDQDLEWIDSLIGKYSNLDVQKIIAVSHTQYSSTAAQKAAQHDIELLTLREAEAADWASKIGPAAIRFFGFCNRPLIVGLRLNDEKLLTLEYTFEGEMKTEDQSLQACAQFFLAMWEERGQRLCDQKISEWVFGNWDMVSQKPNTPRYLEIEEESEMPRTLHLSPTKQIRFNILTWGVGTKYSIEKLTPVKWVMGDKAAVVASALDDQGKPVHITLVSDQSGNLLGASVSAGE